VRETEQKKCLKNRTDPGNEHNINRGPQRNQIKQNGAKDTKALVFVFLPLPSTLIQKRTEHLEKKTRDDKPRVIQVRYLIERDQSFSERLCVVTPTWGQK
jgi:hypothetical protein